MDVVALTTIPADGSAISAERVNDIEGKLGREPPWALCQRRCSIYRPEALMTVEPGSP